MAACRPHIRREGRLWVCRGGATPAGYGYDPCAALREWRLMKEHAGKPADAAQDARPMQPHHLTASVVHVENAHVSPAT